MSSGSAESNYQNFDHPQDADDRVKRGEQPRARSVESPLELFLSAAAESPTAGESRLDRFLSEPSFEGSLRYWLGANLPRDRGELAMLLNRDVARLDELINEQINAILHHPRFQALESAWRGLLYLTQRAEDGGDPNVKIRILNATWKDLERDFERSVEFDQSQLFHKVYDDEFGAAGGEPFGLLLGDYEIHPRPDPDHAHDDISVLRSIAQVAAAAFCPFITSAHPSMFGLDSFGTLQNRLNHTKTFEQLEYLKWKAFRETEDARFVGLTLPRVLMRTPYEDDGTRIDGFRFHEDVSGLDHRKYLWGNAAYSFAGVVIRAFAQAGWLADIRGVQRGVEGGGLVPSLPVHSFGTDRQGIATKCSTDVIITDELEKDLSDLGFMPLCDCKDTDFSAFYSNPSVQKPKKYDRLIATTNARMSAMLQYMLCVSRFAHYVKVLGREKIGAFSEPEDFERLLQNWVVRYVTTDAEASPAVKARFPLRDAKVQVRPQPGKPGSYQCVMHFSPHYELDELTAAVRIATELAPPRTP